MFTTNEYFDGKVKSIAFQSSSPADSKRATVGVMAAGDYVFNTADREKMTVVSGEMQIKRPQDDAALRFGVGQSFEVEANSTFEVSVSADCAYLCEYG